MNSQLSGEALVFGASGFIGRWLVKELLGQQVSVLAAVRSPESASRLLTWLEEHGADASLLTSTVVDFGAEGLGLSADRTGNVRDIFNSAGAFEFGMSGSQARAANVESAERVVALAATVPGLRRLVHVSGYRVGGQDPALVPWPVEKSRPRIPGPRSVRGVQGGERRRRPSSSGAPQCAADHREPVNGDRRFCHGGIGAAGGPR